MVFVIQNNMFHIFYYIKDACYVLLNVKSQMQKLVNTLILISLKKYENEKVPIIIDNY